MTPAVHSHRVIFIDLGRALAVVFMLYGHTASALLAPEYQSGRWFDLWQFQRGLTSSLFLLLGGFAFSIATARHWASHLHWSPALFRRLRRFGLFVLLGYALHLPASRLVDLPGVSEDRWLTFIAVDVLQLIGVTLVAVQLLVLVSRSRLVFTVATLTLAAAVVFATPLVWSLEWDALVPSSLSAYLGPGLGSLFPLFPWAAFVLLGAGFGGLYARWGAAHLASFTRLALLLPGALMIAAASGIRRSPWPLMGTGPGGSIPSEVLVRAGACLLMLAAIAYLSRRLTRLPHVFGAVAQESLLIYFVHLCIVYGSVWNRGLSQAFGPTLTPAQTLVFVLLVIASMVGLAWYWNWWKHARPRAARWTSLAAGALLLYRLL
jgi:uncharacterized membrane protein